MTRNLFHNYYRTDTARAQWHDYNAGAFFITICTANREPYFGTISNKTMYYSEIGRFTHDCIVKMGTLHHDISVPIFQIMPDHIHAIIHVMGLPVEPSYYGGSTHHGGSAHYGGSTADLHPLIENGKGNVTNMHMRDVANHCGRLSHVISRFKCAVTKYARKNNIPFLWQMRFYDRIIRDRYEWDSMAQYITNNVANWALAPPR